MSSKSSPLICHVIWIMLLTLFFILSAKRSEPWKFFIQSGQIFFQVTDSCLLDIVPGCANIITLHIETDFQ